MVSLTETPLTGEPDAGNPPVRFGGRGGANPAIPTPIRIHTRLGQAAEALRDHRSAYGIEVPPRDPQAPAALLDLSAFYNANLDTNWRGMRFFQHNLSTLPRGRQTLGGLEFDVRGGIQLRLGSSRLQYPDAVRGIPVGLPCRRIHFLHAVATGGILGVKAAVYTMQLDDGPRLELPVTVGVDLARWDGHPSWDNPGLAVAWEGTSPAGIPPATLPHHLDQPTARRRRQGD